MKKTGQPPILIPTPDFLIEAANPQLVSMASSVWLLLYAHGEILRRNYGPDYDIPSEKKIKVKTDISYEELVATVCRKVRVNRKTHQVKLLHRHPISSTQFAVVVVTDDDDVEVLMDFVTRMGMSYATEIYVETEQIVQDARDVEGTRKVTQLEGHSEDNQLEMASTMEIGGEPSSKQGITDPGPLQEIDPQVYADGGREYDVFLSFRGTEYRKTFVNGLYHRFCDAGIRTFIDDKELPAGGVIGPELMRAINQSKISIPIFSTDYAQSKWCLKEVTEMVKRMGEKEHLILPIFLDVTPNEVQHQTGSYEKAFSQHEENYGAETVEEWRGALRKVLQLKGLEVGKETNGNQGEFIKLILARVLNRLKKGHVNVNEHFLVGLDNKTEAVKRLLEVGGSGVKIVGIWGMGGIGKTTLAKVVYNQVLDQFESYCFLNNIRETKRTKGLPYLQSKLVSDILHERHTDFANVDEGIQQLKSRLGGKKGIVLLDDVDHVDQLKGLAGNLAWFGPGSRIIITTRDKEVLDQFEVNNIYEVMPLSEDQGFELFCKHAFLKGSPMPELIDLAWDIVKATGMLPLTLEVIGSLLSTKIRRKATWKDTLKKLLRAKPEKAVQNRLELSYDDLGDTEKNIFLDIACIFIGVDSRIVMPMWDDCNWFPNTGIEVLVSKSLIKITDENEFWMHDQIRDLGREIVERESYNHPGLRSRLWRPEEANDVLERNEGTTEVEAISLGHGDGSTFECEGDNFRNLSNLRILRLSRATLGGNFKGLLPKLRWLSWKVWESNATPTDLDLRNLISLDLSGIYTEEWGGWSLMKVASKLKVLDLTECMFLSRTPDLSSFSALERLVLRECSDLCSIDSSIEKLGSLVSLDLRDCLSLEALPNLEHLTKLEELYLGCWEDEFSYFLKELHSGSNRISKVPGLHGLISLETLKIGRSSITHLDGLEMLERLREVEIRSSPIERLPNLSKLKSLTHISLVECEELRQVDEGFAELESLERLTILWCERLVRLPDLSKLHKMKSLIISPCDEITEFRGLGHLKSLEILAIQWLSNLREIAGLAELENLETLILSKAGGIDKLLELSKLQGLKKLADIKTMEDREEGDREGKFHALANLPDMSKLRRLRFLKIEGLSNLTEIVGLEGLDNLETLEVRGCNEMKKLPDLSELHWLKSLTVRDCEITEVPGLGEFESLEEISIYDCCALANLPNMSKLRRLRKFQISGLSYHLREIVGLEGLDNLQTLAVSGCGGIEKLPDLSKLRGLKLLTIGDCYKITEIRGLGDLEFLEELYLCDCKGLGGSVLDLSKLRRLKSLEVAGFTEPPEIVGLEGLDDLERLQVSWFRATQASLRTAVGSRLDVSKLGRLRKLTVKGLGNLVEVVGLGNLKCLDTLTVSKCAALEKLPDLAKLQTVTWLFIDGCDNLTGIGPEELKCLESLTAIRIWGCNSLMTVDFEDLKRIREGKGVLVSGPGDTSSSDGSDDTSRPQARLAPSERGVSDPTTQGNPDSRTRKDRSTTAMDQVQVQKKMQVLVLPEAKKSRLVKFRACFMSCCYRK